MEWDQGLLWAWQRDCNLGNWSDNEATDNVGIGREVFAASVLCAGPAVVDTHSVGGLVPRLSKSGRMEEEKRRAWYQPCTHAHVLPRFWVNRIPSPKRHHL